MTHEDSGHGDISPAYPFAAHGVEVEVDRDTGEVRVLRVVAVHDAGTVINPVGAEGQVVGGVAMGLGMALGEQLIWADGRPHVTGFTDYAMPRADGVPPVEVCFVGGPDPRGTAGGKSISEIALMPVAAAVANAVAHATGARVRTLPITPDKVLAAMPRRRHAAPAPLILRPARWWTEAVRRAYPKGLLRILDRQGPSRTAAPAPKAALERPASVTEALELLATEGAQVVAGGTDLLPARAAGLAGPTRLVSLARCRDLEVVRVDGQDLEIGAAVTLEDLTSALNGSELPGDRVLARAAAAIATPQVRGAATVAGNLCQHNRCWFLRSGFDCYKKGGAGRPCYAVTGDHRYFHAVVDGGRCQSVTPSDLATVMVALDAEFVLRRSGGQRVVQAEAFFTGPGETCLRRGEIVTSVRVPAAARARPAAWDKLQMTSDGFAIASACASLRTDADGCVRSARVVLGGIAATPWRARDSEAMLQGWRGASIDADRASEAWIHRAHPLPGNSWKLDATAGLLRRVLGEALGHRVPEKASP
jgi:CO/xanthine dehydrogenase FAD-binding subunit